MSNTIAPELLQQVRVNGAYVRVLLDWLDAKQIAAPTLRAAVACYAPGDAVPILQWRELLQRAVDTAPGPGRGLEIGAMVGPEHVGMLGYLVLASDNLGQAMYAYQRFESLFYGVQLAQVTITGEYAEISWPASAMASLGLLIDETAIAALIKFLQKLVPNAPSPMQVAFASEAPEQPAVYDTFFGCPVVFNAPCVQVRFPASYLGIPLPTANPALRQLLDRQASALASALPGEDPFALQVQQVMLKLLPEANVSLASVASAMAISVRTLQRRLGNQGVSFQTLLDRTREELARSYLLDPALSMVDITLLLGFSEQSSFNRAFRQWTGSAPGKWRKQQNSPANH